MQALDADAAEARVLPSVRVSFERPYKLYERPRPKGEVHAAGEDEELARWNVGGTGDPSFVSNRDNYHPAPRVRVDTRVVNGRLGKRDRERLLASARKYGYWPFRLCFEAGLRRDQELAGKTVLRVTVTASGRVRRARVLSTKLSDADAAECLAQKSEQLALRPQPRNIGVELSIELWPGDAPVPLAGAPTDPAPENPGALDAEAVLAALESTEPRVRECYQHGVERDAALWGRIQVRVDMNEKGEIVGGRQDESRFPDPEVLRCVLDALRTAAFPAPAGGPLSFVVAVRLGQPPSPTAAVTD